MVNKEKTEINSIAKASAKSIKTSVQKANLVLRLIRGQKVEKALNMLGFSKKKMSSEVLKVLKSAIANAENNHQLDIDKLFVKEASAGKSMVLKRFRPRARGRSGKILKPYSKIRILVEERIQQEVEKPNNQKKKVSQIEEKTDNQETRVSQAVEKPDNQEDKSGTKN